ncbi:hypothetical protein MNBD_ALPHA11-842 [hydrothermal vent metagenome]|uniref:Uncharacterized protein n=1 Tax=hydrothermal vent metagenome TaxID=652676 RepID=A0A3B0T9Z6_9ZZZZ
MLKSFKVLGLDLKLMPAFVIKAFFIFGQITSPKPNFWLEN